MNTPHVNVNYQFTIFRSEEWVQKAILVTKKNKFKTSLGSSNTYCPKFWGKNGRKKRNERNSEVEVKV